MKKLLDNLNQSFNTFLTLFDENSKLENVPLGLSLVETLKK